MNIDDLIQYVSQETLLIGFKLKTRAFLLLSLRLSNVGPTFMHSVGLIKKFSLHNKLLSLTQVLMNWGWGKCECEEKNAVRWFKRDWNAGLFGALLGGHQDLAKWMIEKGAYRWNEGLSNACQGGHKDLVELMIEKGANNWNRGLQGALIGGHKDLAELMIEKGADNWNDGLSQSCPEGHKDLAELMIEKGADD